MSTLLKLGVGLLPILFFLAGLRLLDSFKLLTLRTTLRNIAVGAAVAAVCFAINTTVFHAFPNNDTPYVRFGAPVIEETLKAAYMIWLIRAHRVGFMVDAAISGFAIGAGFALVEDALYVGLFTGGPLLWILRGFGTATMHAGATAIVGIAGSSLAERRGARDLRAFLPGLLVAIAIHSVYNQGILRPVLSAVTILLATPLALGAVFMQSEASLRKWLGDRLDQDVDLLHMIATGQLADTHAGRYLRSLKQSFAPEVVGDMLCLVQVSLELSARAKGDLLMREAGFEAQPDPSLPARFKEMAYLEKSIGAAGRLALAPLLSRSSRDVWQLRLLK